MNHDAPQTTPDNNVLSRYAKLAVPRYTSYPTAPHFSAAGEANDYATWLNSLDPNLPVSLYLHVPYCQKMCWYCGCNMKLAARYAPLASYVTSLLEEIELVRKTIGQRLCVSHIHWGGGTPTALSTDDFSRLMSSVREAFELLPDAEFAVESDPRTLTDDMITLLGDEGVTRASFGVQEFDPKVQEAINRIQPPEMVASCVKKLRQAGIGNINFDLIYGLPYQTVETLANTIDLCAELKPDRIAIFGYAHVPWMAKNQRMIDENALPGPSERIAQMNMASGRLRQMGYEAIGLDHFALPDDSMAIAARTQALQRNFQGYTTDGAETLIGLGASSIGRSPFGYVQNISETGAYARTIQSGRLPIAKFYSFQGQDKLRGHVIERIMCDGEIDLDLAGLMFGQSANWWQECRPALSAMQSDGLLLLEQSGISLTDQGQKLCRVVAAVFDEYREESIGVEDTGKEPQMARHSAAL